MKDLRFCFLHDPDHQQEAAEARRLGGLRRRRERALPEAYELEDLDRPGGVTRLLQIVLTDALALDTGVGRARILLAIASIGIRLRESLEFEARLSALEAAQRRQMADPARDTLDGGLLDEPLP